MGVGRGRHRPRRLLIAAGRLFNLARSSVVVAGRDKVRALELVREAIAIQRPPAAFREGFASATAERPNG
ncbi:hypothetical protein IOD16_34615 [Saccharothrix sp. 6-C]|uniref:hypothetical protein n=1 Tax=Saccharothrix sp. 6-C TaxID=2781735 RepID=UPI0019179357|nr:hypothetical protein [Saccharothrix sp. 6-C]QQQ76120.1 hypothetical protein IOD16_34615 [Saccharothrix sp. 6-C]